MKSILAVVLTLLENLPDNWRARLIFHIINDREYRESFELDTAVNGGAKLRILG